MAKLIRTKISASTLIEVLIAMVMIMIVFTMAISIFGNVMKGGISQKKLQVRNQLHVLKNHVQNSGDMEFSNLDIDSVTYVFSTSSTTTPGLSQLEIRAHQGTVDLGEIKCLYKPKTIGQ